MRCLVNQHLSSLPQSNSQLSDINKKIYYTSKRIDIFEIESELNLTNLCNALSTNTSLKTLCLRGCSEILPGRKGIALYQLLRKNYFLETLDLSYNIVTSCHVGQIAAGLAVNKTLKILSLNDCELTDRSIEVLLTGLINNIEELNMRGNNSITEEGMKTLARHLTTHCPKLNTLRIPARILTHSSTKKVFKETNKERKRNKLTEIDVKNY